MEAELTGLSDGLGCGKGHEGKRMIIMLLTLGTEWINQEDYLEMLTEVSIRHSSENVKYVAGY